MQIQKVLVQEISNDGSTLPVTKTNFVEFHTENDKPTDDNILNVVNNTLGADATSLDQYCHIKPLTDGTVWYLYSEESTIIITIIG